jgi:hypothetical protein
MAARRGRTTPAKRKPPAKPKEEERPLTRPLLNDFHRACLKTGAEWINYVLVSADDTDDPSTGLIFKLAYKGTIYELWSYETPEEMLEAGDPWAIVLQKAETVWDTLQESGTVDVTADRAAKAEAIAQSERDAVKAETEAKRTAIDPKKLGEGPGESIYIPDNFDGSQRDVVFLGMRYEGQELRYWLRCGQLNFVPSVFIMAVRERLEGGLAAQNVSPAPGAFPRLGVSGQVAQDMLDKGLIPEAIGMK